jgi:hypothetical protein
MHSAVAGARAHLTANVINAFSLLRRSRFDAAVIEHGLHNEAFDLCLELRDLGIPYISCKSPHRLKKAASLKRDADHAVWRLGDILASRADLDAGYTPIERTAYESKASVN